MMRSVAFGKAADIFKQRGGAGVLAGKVFGGGGGGSGKPPLTMPDRTSPAMRRGRSKTLADWNGGNSASTMMRSAM